MAATKIGTAGLVFGVTADVGGYIQSSRYRESIQTAEVADEDGDIVGASLYGASGEISQELIFTTDTLAPHATALGAQVANAGITNHTTTGTLRMTERETAKTNTGFKTISYTLKHYPEITPEV
jgi:hypothetical protein